MKNNYIKFLTSGILTTIQDLRRKGYKKYGIPESGPLDKKSAMYANFLVGNPLKNEVIETTFKGPKIKFYFSLSDKNQNNEKKLSLLAEKEINEIENKYAQV